MPPSPTAATPAPSSAATASTGDWVSLFDGRTLAGWHAFNKTTGAPSGWRVDEGAIHFAPGGDGGDIATDAQYGDFEFEVEWKIQACGNSGIFYRGAEGAAYNAVYLTAPEMQVLDDTCHPDARFPSHTAGGLYDLYVPRAAVVRPAGEWNQARIVARGGHIEHWLNGTMIVEAEQGSAAWNARVAASKFRTMPAFGTQRSGVIALQDHGDRVWYRALRIRTLG